MARIKLRPQKILVTGGGSGIGLAIADRLIEAEASVVIAGRKIEKVQTEAEKLHNKHPNGRIFAMQMDISDTMAIPEKLNEASSLMDGLDGFVNSAGIGTGAYTGRGYEPFDITSEEWDTLCNTNFKGAYFMLRNEIEFLLKHDVCRSNILNIASNGAFAGIRGSYGASKLAVAKWTESFGKSYGSKGIIINCIAPGATFTDMISRYAKDINQKYERHAIGRFIRPDEIAELAHYMMSDFGEILSGTTIIADGGDNARYS